MVELLLTKHSQLSLWFKIMLITCTWKFPLDTKTVEHYKVLKCPLNKTCKQQISNYSYLPIGAIQICYKSRKFEPFPINAFVILVNMLRSYFLVRQSQLLIQTEQLTRFYPIAVRNQIGWEQWLYPCSEALVQCFEIQCL